MDTHTLRGHRAWVTACAVSADGGTGLSASDDRTLIVWDLASGAPRRVLYGHEDGVSGCAVSADGGIGLSASHDRTLNVWDLASDAGSRSTQHLTLAP